MRTFVALFGLLALTAFAPPAHAATPELVGETVLGTSEDGHNLVGTVTRVFGNTAEVRWQTQDGDPVSFGLAYWPVGSLSVQVGISFAGRVFTFDDTSATNPLFTGTISRTFANGVNEVRWTTGGASYFRAADLYTGGQCTDTTICGKNVLGTSANDHTLVGRVTALYAPLTGGPNTTAEVRWTIDNGEPTSSTSYWPISALQIQTE
jgi:hypothetical protein